MNEMKNYDLGANLFYKTQKIVNLPLLSWDLFASHFDTLCKSHSDITALSAIATINKWNYKSMFTEELVKKEHVILVTDTQLRIVHATHNMFKMNGYTSKEVMGNKPKMFQGEATCQEQLRHVSKAVKNEMPFEVTLMNYRKDGSLYKCWIKAEPIFNTKGKIVNFIAYEREVA